MYLFGHFDLDGTTFDTFNGLNEAILGIREAAQPMGRGASHTHIALHATASTVESGAFMFGTDPEQPQAMPWADLCFVFGAPEDR